MTTTPTPPLFPTGAFNREALVADIMASTGLCHAAAEATLQEAIDCGDVEEGEDEEMEAVG